MEGFFKVLLLLTVVGTASAIWSGQDSSAQTFFAFVRSSNPGDGYNDYKFCGGVIVDSYTILTTPLCVSEKSSIIVTVGESFLFDYDVDARNYTAVCTSVDDIAVLRTTGEMETRQNFVVPGSLAMPTSDLASELYDEGDTVTMVGFGQTETPGPSGGYISDNLQIMTHRIVPSSECEEMYGDLYDSETMMCTATESDEDDGADFNRPKAGDWGGPIFRTYNVDGTDTQFLLGLMVFGAGTEKPDAALSIFPYIQNGWLGNNLPRSGVYFQLWREASANMGLVLAFSSSSDEPLGFICNDGIGRNEVDAICSELGYTYGTVMDPYNVGQGQYYLPSQYPFVGADLYCPAGADLANECYWTDYERTGVPCPDGKQLAVSCSDERFELGVDWFYVSESRSKTKFAIAADVMRYGMELENIDRNVDVIVWNINENNEVERVLEPDQWKYKSNSNYWTAKAPELVEDSCFVGSLSIRGTSVFAFKFDAGCSRTGDFTESMRDYLTAVFLL